jgi:uncharacterized membrane protein YgdD (TMEM256/DUF423 family)
MRDPLLLVAALLGASGVTLGAFGAHGLRARLGESLSTWETGITYHLVHALALLGIALLLRLVGDSALLRWAGWAMAFGVLAFSGSLYALALDGPRWLGPVTPVGGLGFLLGWSLLAGFALREAG